MFRPSAVARRCRGKTDDSNAASGGASDTCVARNQVCCLLALDSGCATWLTRIIREKWINGDFVVVNDNDGDKSRICVSRVTDSKAVSQVET